MVDDQKDRNRVLGRRRLLKAGAMAAPVVFTLRARPASAQINPAYANRAYSYGINAGLTSTQLDELRKQQEGATGQAEEVEEDDHPSGGTGPYGGDPFGGPGPYDGNPFGSGVPFDGSGF